MSAGGYGARCDLRVNDTSVSREHAWIERQDDRYFIKDNQSTVSTYVNGARVRPGERRELRPSDEVTLGTVDLIFLDASGFYHFVRTLFGE